MATEDIRTPQVGDLLHQRYRLVEELGQGAFGIVFRANHTDLDEDVVVKVLKPGVVRNASLLQRFQREVFVAKKLKHPNTIRIFDCSETAEGLPFYVMEFLQGTSLDDLIEEEYGLTQARTHHIIMQVLKGLVEAHSNGVVHRDLKPENVLICDIVGETDFVKLLDFGIAKALEGTGAKLTQTETILGTPNYMSPEQALGQSDVDARSDLYSVGLIMAECLTGDPVVMGRDVVQMLCKQASEAALEMPPELLGTPLWPIIARATAKDVDQRFQSALEMLEAMRALPPLPAAKCVTGTVVGSEEMARVVAETVRTLDTTPAQAHHATTVEQPTEGRKGLFSTPGRMAAASVIFLAPIVALGLWMSSQGIPNEEQTEAPAGETDAGESLQDNTTVVEPEVGLAAGEPDTPPVVEPANQDTSSAIAFARAMERVTQAVPEDHAISFQGLSDVTVTVAGQSIGTTPFSWNVPRLQHEVEVSFERPGYRSETKQVMLNDAVVDVALGRRRREHGRDEPEGGPPENLFGGSRIDHTP